MNVPENFDQCTTFIFTPATKKSYNEIIFAIKMFSRTGHGVQCVAGCPSYSRKEGAWLKSKLIPQ